VQKRKLDGVKGLAGYTITKCFPFGAISAMSARNSDVAKLQAIPKQPNPILNHTKTKPILVDRFSLLSTVSSETPSSIDDAENEWPTKLVTDAAHVSRVRFAV